VAKWDYINKHANKGKGFDSKWIMDTKCMFVRNEIAYVHLFIIIVLQQLSNVYVVKDK